MECEDYCQEDTKQYYPYYQIPSIYLAPPSASTPEHREVLIQAVTALQTVTGEGEKYYPRSMTDYNLFTHLVHLYGQVKADKVMATSARRQASYCDRLRRSDVKATPSPLSVEQLNPIENFNLVLNMLRNGVWPTTNCWVEPTASHYHSFNYKGRKVNVAGDSTLFTYFNKVEAMTYKETLLAQQYMVGAGLRMENMLLWSMSSGCTWIGS